MGKNPVSCLFFFDSHGINISFIIHAFQLLRQTFGTALNYAQSTHPLTSGVPNSKRAHVPKADILNSWLINMCRQRNSIVYDGYWHQRADERHGNPPQGNQELLVVRDKVGRPPGELGVSKSMECDIFPFSALTLLVGRQEGHLGL